MRNRRLVRLSALAITVAACGDSAVRPVSPLSTPRMATLGTSNSHQYLPYGVRIPPGQHLTLLPKPYDRLRDGPPIPNTTPQLNLVGKPGFVPPPPPMGHLDRRLPPPGDGQAAIAVNIYPGSTNKWYGISQTNAARPTMQLPVAPDSTEELLYAPTVLPPGGTCIEATTIHEWYPLNPHDRRYQAWYNWCGTTGWGGFESMADTAFSNNYLRVLGSDTVLSITVSTPDTANPHGACWYGYLYNYTLGGWEQKYSSCGSGTTSSPSGDNGNDGWTAWESWYLFGGYSSGFCPYVPSIFSTDIELLETDDHTAHPITDYSYVGSPYLEIGGENRAGCWSTFDPDGPWTFGFPTTYDSMTNSWLATTPAGNS